MSVDREVEEEEQEEEEEPEDEAGQLQDTMQRYFSSTNQSANNPTNYSPPPALPLSSRPVSKHSQTLAPVEQPSFQIKGLASASTSTFTPAPAPSPVPAPKKTSISKHEKEASPRSV
jgi:hypothetical protein